MNYNSFNISYEQFKERFLEISDPQDAALFSCVYCAYSRIGEIVRSRKGYRHNPPLSKNNVEFTSSHLILTILTEKSGQWRKVPSSRKLEDWLHEPIRNWLNVCGEELFPYSTRWAEYRFEKWFGTGHIHLLRHWACTHALQGKRTKERLQPQYVARLGGWTSFNSFYQTYSHFTVDDFIDQI